MSLACSSGDPFSFQGLDTFCGWLGGCVSSVAIAAVGCFSVAYKHADGKKIDGRRVLVDVERGRTVKGWRPRRLG